jgi:[ribosomal protein S5]-alanine N-acetyltransferase
MATRRTQLFVTLRRPHPSDVDAILAWRSEPAARLHQPLRDLAREELLFDLQALENAQLAERTRDRYQWIIEAGARPAGWVTLVIRSWEHHIAEVGYSLGSEFHGKGVGTEAVRHLVTLAFDEGNLYRLEARCSIHNPASYRLLERLGFKREGVLREYFLLHGERVDHYFYSLLRSEWKE